MQAKGLSPQGRPMAKIEEEDNNSQADASEDGSLQIQGEGESKVTFSSLTATSQTEDFMPRLDDIDVNGKLKFLGLKYSIRCTHRRQFPNYLTNNWYRQIGWNWMIPT